MQDSIWIKQSKPKAYSTLTNDVHSDIIIVGAGLCGLSLAYYLMKAKKSFVVVDANQVGYGASGRNTGKITSQHGIVYQHLINTFSTSLARSYHEANEDAICSIESIIVENHIQCDLQHVNSIVFAKKQKDVEEIDSEIKAYDTLGIPYTTTIDSTYQTPFIKGIKMKNQAQYDPYAYCLGLADCIHRQGHDIYEHTPIREIEKEEGRYILKSEHCILYAKKIVLCTQFPFLDQKQLYFSKLFNDQSSIEYQPIEKESFEQLIGCGKDVVSYRTLCKNNQPYLLKGVNHHHVGRDIPTSIITPHQWSSQDYTTSDKLPLIGQLVDGDSSILFASGFQKWGNTLSNVAAKLLCAMLLDTPSPYEEMFNPHRKGLLLNTTSIKENAKTAFAYIQNKMQIPTNVHPKKGCATLIQWQDAIYGVYKDEQDEVFIVNTKCPHLGCQCVFNEVDKTWDCPCHGSRFSYRGEVIKGPSTYHLQHFDESTSINPHLFMKTKK